MKVDWLRIFASRGFRTRIRISFLADVTVFMVLTLVRAAGVVRRASG